MMPVETLDCPYCGERIELLIDDSVDLQEYVEDCAVCCRPIDVRVRVDERSRVHVSVKADTD